MAIQRTFSIIKPDATKRNLTGQIVARIEAAGLRVVASKRLWMTRQPPSIANARFSARFVNS
jgi:nucleoside-diphosphate kinase